MNIYSRIYTNTSVENMAHLLFLEKEDNPRPLHQNDAYIHILIKLQNPAAEQSRPGNEAKHKPRGRIPLDNNFSR